MRIAIFGALALVLCGCGQGVEISTSEWICSRTGDVQRYSILPRGKLMVPATETVLGCVQWTRRGVKL